VSVKGRDELVAERVAVLNLSFCGSRTTSMLLLSIKLEWKTRRACGVLS